MVTDFDPEALQRACGDDPSWICDRVYRSTENETVARTVDFLVARPLQIGIILLIAAIVARLLRRAIRRFTLTLAARASSGLIGGKPDLRATSRAETLGAVLRSVAGMVVWGIAGLTILGELGINLAPIIAGAGIAGIAIGFGAQSLVKDFLSGIFMVLEDQYGVGDVVDVGEAIGVVEAVTLRSTRVRDVNGTLWHVPNGEIVRVGNKSQLWSRAVLDIAVAHGTDIDRASEVIGEAARTLRDDPKMAEALIDDPEVWGVENIDAAGVTLRLAVKTQPAAHVAVLRELRAWVNAALDREGINRPPPPTAPRA